MAICPTDSAVYQEEIKTIVFREDDGIMIPKLVREAAFELSIDVIIRSIPRETYKNYSCSPPESFYGYATVVLQDALDLKIPLQFPRQRIYYGRVAEAFAQWNALVNFEYMKAYFAAVGDSLASLGTALGVTPVFDNTCCSLPEPTWRELPIREAYVNVPDGTQYEIEISWLAPIPFSDSCGTFFEGLSGQVDGDKDDGLPPNGIFPNVATKVNNPYGGLPPATPDSEQGGFSSSKIANLGDADPDSEAIPEEDRTYYLETTWTYYAVGVPVTSVIRNVCPAGSKLIVENVSAPGVECGPNSVNRSAWVSVGDSNTKGAQIGNACTIGAITAVLKEGTPP